MWTQNDVVMCRQVGMYGRLAHAREPTVTDEALIDHCLINDQSHIGRHQVQRVLTLVYHHHHHHIHFRALFSSTEGWAFWQVFLEGVLSTQNSSECQQNPYLASFCHSSTLHPMISLACQIFSVQPHSACVLLQSSLCCALHVQTISSYWCGAPHLNPGCQALWEGNLS